MYVLLPLAGRWASHRRKPAPGPRALLEPWGARIRPLPPLGAALRRGPAHSLPAPASGALQHVLRSEASALSLFSWKWDAHILFVALNDFLESKYYDSSLNDFIFQTKVIQKYFFYFLNLEKASCTSLILGTCCFMKNTLCFISTVFRIYQDNTVFVLWPVSAIKCITKHLKLIFPAFLK